ncbi:MAG: pentapeptide repeat-containing protein [Gammaproteobacteria bacterium]|nr:pentapeptide repeat-containing protein [Gammaproteobacteria bacterium]
MAINATPKIVDDVLAPTPTKNVNDTLTNPIHANVPVNPVTVNNNRSLPHNRAPQTIFEWILQVRDPIQVHDYLKQLRKENYASKFKHTGPLGTVLHALTTNKIQDVNLRELNAAKENLEALNAIPADAIIQMIILAITLIIKILEASSMCKKKTERDQAKAEFINLVKSMPLMNYDNVFINLPHMRLDNADLSIKLIDNNTCGPNLEYANLEGARLTKVTLCQANLNKANLRGSQWIDSNLLYANTQNADIRWADLSTSQISTPPIGSIALKTFLMTTYPAQVGVPLPNVAQLKAALSFIEADLTAERLLGKTNGWNGSAVEHNHHARVTNNLLRLTKYHPEARKELLLEAAQHPYFTQEKSAQAMQVVNKCLVDVNKLFHHHQGQTLVTGSSHQRKLINEAYREQPRLALKTL